MLYNSFRFWSWGENMLKFIYGRAATGKSYNIINCISRDVSENRDVVLLVPEQFTFESERALLSALGDRAGTDVSVLSFTRMYDEISRRVGGRVANNISDSDRVIIMNRAFKAVQDKLQIWGKYVNSMNFTSNVIAAITEFKTAAVTPEDIEAVANQVLSNYLSLKLKDISVIYSAYNALLGNVFLDPVDDLTRLNEKLLGYRYFEGKNVYIDSFKNFTGQQYKIIERIVSQADNVFVSLTTDDITSNELSIFSNVNKTAEKITEISKKYAVRIDTPEKFEINHYKGEGVRSLEVFLSKACTKIENSADLEIVKCESLSNEAEFAARTIRKLVRENGYRYKDFIIIARNAEAYQKFIEKHCKDNDVFCFTDKRKKIDNSPLSVFISSAISLAISLNTDEIFNFHKTALTDMSVDELAVLENYTYLWNVKGSMWTSEWTMNPNGFLAATDDSHYCSDYASELERINELRNRAIMPIIRFRQAFTGTPKNLVSAIIKLLNDCSVADNLKKHRENCKDNNLAYEAEELRLSWDAIMELLDGFVKCLPDSEISSADFYELWKTALGFISVGNIPQTVDEVTFGSADRIKPSRPKIAFVLGVNQGVFPAKITSSGVFAGNEREVLRNNGLEIPDYGISAVIDEEYLLYSSLCCATEKLFITFSAADNSGNALEPSQIIKEIIDGSENLTIKEYTQKKLCCDNLPETQKTAHNRLFAAFCTDKQAYHTVKEALKDREATVVEDIIENFSKNNASVSDQNARLLFGNKINISPSGFDTFHRCKFSYFCKYGLRLNKIQPAEFDVLQRGTLSHYVLENLVKKYLDVFSEFTRNDSDAKVTELVSEYLSLIDGYERIETPRIKFLVNIITASLKDVAYHIVCEMSQCDFRPEYFELKIDKDGVIPSLSVPFSDSGEMRLRGSIDRVDIYGDYVRIVDYKTGTRVFKLPDILVGLNLQMLIYLYTVVRGDNAELNTKSPAGILYMPSKRDFGDPKVLSMNGLILLDKAVMEAMDKGGKGVYIPKHPFKADGSLSARSSSFAEPEIFTETFNYIELLLKKMGTTVHSGDFAADPVDGIDSSACKYCDFSSICCFEKAEHKCADKSLSSKDVLEQLKEANKNGI